MESDWECLKETLRGQQNGVIEKQGSIQKTKLEETGPIDRFIRDTRKTNMKKETHNDFIKDLRLNNNSNVMDISQLTGRSKNDTKSSNLNDKDSSTSERDKNPTPTSKKSEKGLFYKPAQNFIKNTKNKNRPPLKVNSFKRDNDEQPTKSPNSQYSKIRVENIKQKKSTRKLFDLEKGVEDLTNQTPQSSENEEDEERTIPSTKFYPKSVKNSKKGTSVKSFTKQKQMVKTPTSSNLNKKEIAESRESNKRETPNGNNKQDKDDDDVKFKNNEEIAALLREKIKPVLNIISQLEKLRKINLKPQKELFNKQIKAVINKIK